MELAPLATLLLQRFAEPLPYFEFPTLSKKEVSSCSERVSRPITITIGRLTGQTYPVQVHTLDTGFDIKAVIQQKESIPIDQQRLVFKGRLIENRVKLAHYGIVDGSKIHLSLRLRGGMYHVTSGHSELDQSFMLRVYLCDEPLVLQVHNGVSLKELRDLITKASEAASLQEELEGRRLLVEGIPLKIKSEDETLGELGIGPEGTPNLMLIR